MAEFEEERAITPVQPLKDEFALYGSRKAELMRRMPLFQSPHFAYIQRQQPAVAAFFRILASATYDFYQNSIEHLYDQIEKGGKDIDFPDLEVMSADENAVFSLPEEERDTLYRHTRDFEDFRNTLKLYTRAFTDENQAWNFYQNLKTPQMTNGEMHAVLKRFFVSSAWPDNAWYSPHIAFCDFRVEAVHHLIESAFKKNPPDYSCLPDKALDFLAVKNNALAAAVRLRTLHDMITLNKLHLLHLLPQKENTSVFAPPLTSLLDRTSIRKLEELDPIKMAAVIYWLQKREGPQNKIVAQWGPTLHAENFWERLQENPLKVLRKILLPQSIGALRRQVQEESMWFVLDKKHRRKWITACKNFLSETHFQQLYWDRQREENKKHGAYASLCLPQIDDLKNLENHPVFSAESPDVEELQNFFLYSVARDQYKAECRVLYELRKTDASTVYQFSEEQRALIKKICSSLSQNRKLESDLTIDFNSTLSDPYRPSTKKDCLYHPKTASALRVFLTDRIEGRSINSVLIALDMPSAFPGEEYFDEMSSILDHAHEFPQSLAKLYLLWEFKKYFNTKNGVYTLGEVERIGRFIVSETDEEIIKAIQNCPEAFVAYVDHFTVRRGGDDAQIEYPHPFSLDDHFLEEHKRKIINIRFGMRAIRNRDEFCDRLPEIIANFNALASRKWLQPFQERLDKETKSLREAFSVSTSFTSKIYQPSLPHSLILRHKT